MGGSSSILESIALQTHQGPSINSGRNCKSSTSGRSNTLLCDYCGETGHSKQWCYEIIGYPEWWDFSKKPRKKSVGKLMVANVSEGGLKDGDMSIAHVAHSDNVGHPDSEDSWLWC
eukprot:XP_015580324.1 uncharacterized protein LOC107261989 [Ricinus communis]